MRVRCEALRPGKSRFRKHWQIFVGLAPGPLAQGYTKSTRRIGFISTKILELFITSGLKQNEL